MRREKSDVQAASDINSPVSGEVTEVNSSLTDESSKVPELLYGLHSAILHKGMYVDWLHLMPFRLLSLTGEPGAIQRRLDDEGKALRQGGAEKSHGPCTV